MKKIERNLSGEFAVYTSPVIRAIGFSLRRPVLENSRVDGDDIDDVTEEDNPFFS